MLIKNPLADITRGYWQLSQVWEGRSDLPITTAQALEITKEAAIHLNPARAIAKAFVTLETAIIQGGPTNNSKATANAS